MGMKGHPQSNCGAVGGGGGGWMKKKKMAMVAVVILVGVMGVMVVQKVRDRRLFNLVIKEKDRQILSLQLLLQKEKQYAKESKRKNQDLSAKLFSLRTDKTQLNNNILEMRSTITSMRDEQRALESTIHEMQKEINLKQSQIIQTPCLNPQPNLTATKHLESTDGKHPQTGLHIQQNPSREDDRDLGKLASQIQNTTETNGRLAATMGFKENGNGGGLTMKRRSFVGGAIKGQRNKSLITQINGHADKSQVTPNLEEGPTLFKSNNYSTDEGGNRSSGKAAIDEEIKSKADRMDDEDEDEGETEADMNASSGGSEADQDYKEETQD
ncbi:hypothetical protein L6452_17393 [Arctium lappa]|uniref:Uncharacterized protein n=1 Tax=Arctium lappa TaxID=4217 RepID=A0ACB9C386_ARCLA|nr:hypothetical protein L6452_17393 [Arctium lappa]